MRKRAEQGRVGLWAALRDASPPVTRRDGAGRAVTGRRRVGRAFCRASAERAGAMGSALLERFAPRLGLTDPLVLR